MKHVNIALFVVHKGCPHTCSFCNQRSITGIEKEIGPEDVRKAAQTALGSLDESEARGGEIAFFGGSFTMVNRDYMMSLLDAAYEYVERGLFKGIRISTRPDGIDDGICSLLKSRGVTAVELGAQSMNDRVLEMNERGHTAQQVADASVMLKDYGFELGLQMMTGLYGSDDEDSIETAKKIIDLRPATVRIYPTVVLRNTKLHELMQKGEFEPADVEHSVSLCARLIPMFEQNGIKVIRVGLHSGGDVEKNYAGGAYHPAFRELCEGRIFLNAALRELSSEAPGRYIIEVGKGNVSKMTGQKRFNLDYLAERGYECTVREADLKEKYEIKVRLNNDT